MYYETLSDNTDTIKIVNMGFAVFMEIGDDVLDNAKWLDKLQKDMGEGHLTGNHVQALRYCLIQEGFDPSRETYLEIQTILTQAKERGWFGN